MVRPAERVHLAHQADRALDEHRVGIDDQRRRAGVGQHVGVVVQGAQRVQRQAAVALGLAGAGDHQHLGPIQRQEPRDRTRSRAQRIEGLDVLADAVGQLAAGQRGVAQVQHRFVAVPFERADEQVAGMDGVA
jgi:hypothetical protein